MKLVVPIIITLLLVIKSIYIEKNNIFVSFSNEYFEINKNKPVFKQLESLIFKQSSIKKIKKTYSNLNFDNETKKMRKSIDFFNDIPNNDITDHVIKNRTIKFFINNSCNVVISESISYYANINTTSIEHIVLHNNALNIVPTNVTSSDVEINLFTFNKELNIFYVFFPVNNATNKQINIEYTYEAVGLIKSTDSNLENDFLWKFLNQNISKSTELKIEVIIQSNDFGIDKINSNLPFEIKKHNSNINCEWKGRINSQEILIMTMKFPLLLKDCEVIRVDYLMTFLGVLFLSFFLGMMYIIISSFLFKDY